ncbi:MAG: nucleotidyltransferase domain-containing protein [Vulcanimicrobiaceae bacterium]
MNHRLTATITPERRFLMAASRLCSDPEQVQLAAAAVRNWNAVLDEGRHHHLLPLIANASTECSSVPSDVKAQISKQLQIVRMLNALYFDEAKHVLETMRGHGLKPVVLKGMALAESLYGDIGLRPLCDLDVLFSIEDIPRAEQILRSMNYLQEPSPHDAAWYFEHYYQLPRFVRRGGRFCIELHWDLGRRPNPFTLDIATMRERAVPVAISGVDVFMFDREDMLLHLALHLAWGNGFDGHFRGLVDIAELTRVGINWTEFAQRVRAANAAPVVVPALELAAWLLDAPIPEDTLAVLSRERGSAMTRYITAIGQSRIFAGGAGHRTWMRLAWLRSTHERLTLLRQNFGPVEHAERDTRPWSGARLLQGAQRAIAVFLPSHTR